MPPVLLEKAPDTASLVRLVCLFENVPWYAVCLLCGRCFLRAGAGHQPRLSDAFRGVSP